jgi:hypothetical protein
MAPSDPPIQLWMNNNRRYREGERVKLQVDVESDGYLLVLHYDTDGRVRVLFPLDPRDNTQVRAGRRYEVRDENGEGAFLTGEDGTGLVLTALATEPFRLDEVVREGGWDYTRLSVSQDAEDPEQELAGLVGSLAGPDGFDYDIVSYQVYETTIVEYRDYYPRSPVYVYGDYFSCYNSFWSYHDCWPYHGGWAVRIGYSPYRYRPFGYGYYPYYPYYPYYYPRGPVHAGRGPILAGRPRDYTVIPRSRGSGTFGTLGESRGPTGDVRGTPVNWRPRSGARPADPRTPEARGSNPGRRVEPRGAVTPPARRARPGSTDVSRPARTETRESAARPERREAVPERRAEPTRSRARGSEGRVESPRTAARGPERRAEAPARPAQRSDATRSRGGSPPPRAAAPSASRGGGSPSRGNGGGGGSPRSRPRP